MNKLTHVYYEENIFDQEKIRMLQEELKEQEIDFAPLGKLEKSRPENILMICQSQELIHYAAANKIAALGVERDNQLVDVAYVYQESQSIDAKEILLVYHRFHGQPMIIGETKRTLIRELELADLDALYELYQGEGICDYMEPLYERKAEEAYQKDYIANIYGFYGYGMWLVFDKANGGLIGRAGIEQRTILGESHYEIGYVIDTRYQRQGYAFEVCQFLLLFAREQLGVSSLSAFIQMENKPSICLAKKMGMEEKKSLILDGKEMLWYERQLV